MNWRLKCLGFHAINHLPYGEAFHAWAQRHITGRYYRTFKSDRFPSQRWHLWVLDVDGARVVIQAMDYPGTPEARRAELQAMVASIKIEP